MKKSIVLLLLTSCFSHVCFCQWDHRNIITNDNITYPETSKYASIAHTIGITEITINYHQPAVRNRKIFGELISYGRVWRAGANECTTFTIQDDVLIENQLLKAGKYSLHVIPDRNEWVIIFSKNHTQWGSFYYNQKEDALRIKVNPSSTIHQEYLKYDFEHIHDNKANVVLKWSDTKIAFTISVDEIATSMSVIEDELRTIPRFSWKGNREAAFYLWLHNAQLENALTIINRSIEYEERFENVYLKALILKSFDRNEEAKKYFDIARKMGNENMYLYCGREAVGHHNSPEKALELFRIAETYFPNSYQPKMLIGRTYGWMGNALNAREALAEAMSHTTSDKEKASVEKEMRIYNL